MTTLASLVAILLRFTRITKSAQEPFLVEKLKARAAANGRSLQAELKAILEAQASQMTKAEARALAARIRRRIGSRLQTDSGMLQAEDRER